MLKHDGVIRIWNAVFGAPDDISRSTFLRAFAGIMVLAAGLRFWNLDGVALWGDESITIMQSRLPLETILFGNIDYHPSLSVLVQHVWSALFADFGLARVPAALAGTLTVLVVMLGVRDFSSRRAALFSGLLLAVTTGHVFFSQETRMYALLVLGFALASWGATGFSLRGLHRRWSYTALYVTGGVIMIGSHVIGLVLMAIVGMIGMLAALSAVDRKTAMMLAIVANLILAILAGPWILHILSVSGDHPGMLDKPVTVLVWYIANMTGFPALGAYAKLIELALYLLALSSILVAWLHERRALAALLLGLVVLVPMTLGLMHLIRPVLENRVVLPSVIGISMGFGVALAHVHQRTIRTGLLVVIVGAALSSTLIELTHREKWDDYRGALAFADEHGFGDAAVLICRNYGGSAILIERPSAEVFYYKPDGVLVQSTPGYWRISAVPISELEKMPAPEIDDWLGGGYLVDGGLEAVLAEVDQVAFIRPFCLRGDEAVIEAALASAGFKQQAHALIRPYQRPKILVTSRTHITLYQAGSDQPE